MIKHKCPLCQKKSDCFDPNCDGLRNKFCQNCIIIIRGLKAKKEIEDMMQKFKEDPKHFDQKLEDFPNVKPKGKRRTKIPNKTIPLLIRALFENSQRFRKDAEVLLNSKSYESAIVRLYESTEELIKLVILLSYYKKQEDVPKEEVDRLFSKHYYRLKEFARHFHDSTFGQAKEDEQEYMEWYFGHAGYYDQDVKEKLIYVDWVDDNVHNPLNFGEIALNGRELVNEANKIAFQNKSFEIDSVMNSLKKDSDFQKIMSEYS